MEFKDMLKKLRESQGLRQVALSEKLGMSKSIIGLYETGERMASATPGATLTGNKKYPRLRGYSLLRLVYHAL